MPDMTRSDAYLKIARLAQEIDTAHEAGRLMTLFSKRRDAMFLREITALHIENGMLERQITKLKEGQPCDTLENHAGISEPKPKSSV